MNNFTIKTIKKVRIWKIIYRLFKIHKIYYKTPPLPTVLTIEPNNTCNLKCPTCATGNKTLTRPKKAMSLVNYKKIIDQVENFVGKIDLYGFGEPFLNKDILPMIQYTVKSKIFVCTSTNGHFFHSLEYCQMLVKSGLNKLIVSVDGADQDTLERFRKNANLGNVIRGLENLVKAKKALNSKTPYIELQFIIMKHNEHQRQKMQQLSDHLSIDAYSEKLLGLDTRSPNFQSRANKYLPTDLELRRYYRDKNNQYHLKGKQQLACKTILGSAIIWSDGSVSPCCYDWNCNYNMGNVFLDSFKKVWSGKRYQNFRQRVFSINKPSMCSICPAIRNISIKN